VSQFRRKSLIIGNLCLKSAKFLAVDAVLFTPVRYPIMAEGYCVKCKAKKEIADAVEEVMKNGRKAIKGRCPTCGTVMFKILGGKAAAATPSEKAPAPDTTPNPSS
jgi:hypothetical protein